MAEKQLEKFYKTLTGKGALALDPPDDPYYVHILQAKPDKDPILKLRQRIQFSESESVNLLTGFRGNGKSTELRRLKKLLEENGCYVVLVNMLDYMLMTKPLEISDFILSIMSALAVEMEKSGYKGTTETYLKRLDNLLKSEVELSPLTFDLKAPGAAAKLGFNLKSEPTFKKKLQEAMRGHVTTLIEDSRKYVVDLVTEIRKKENNPDKKVVLLVDSMEQLRGDGEEAETMHKSIVNVFSRQASNLEFRMLHVVYTIPPYLLPLAPNLARNLGGNPVNAWPNIHVRKKNNSGLDEEGLNIMEEIIKKRFSSWSDFFSREQLGKLALASGGDLRDFFRLVRECLVISSISLKENEENRSLITDETLIQSIRQLQNELLPIPTDDRPWLSKVHETKSTELQNISELPRLARFLDSNLIMNYLNDEPWYDVHPLIIDDIKKK